MSRDWSTLALWCSLGATAACSGALANPVPEPAPSGTPPVASASAAPSVSPVRHTPLAERDEVILEAALRPVPGERSAILVASDLLRDLSYVRRIVASQLSSSPLSSSPPAQPGPVHVLRGRHPVGALDVAADGSNALLVSSDGERLCFERLTTAGGAPALHCHALRANAMFLLAGAPALIIERELPAEDDKPRDDDTGTQMQIFVQRLTADGALDGDRVDSELTFPRPLVGMGFVDAIGTTTGARVMWYEMLKPRKEGSEKIKRAALKTARLDRDGKLVDASRVALMSGDRGYGDILGHSSPQLFSRNDRALFVGRVKDEQQNFDGYEVMRLGPKEPVMAPNTVLGVDPLRMSELRALEPGEVAVYQALWDAAPRLVPGQSPSDAARVAWVGDRGWFFRDDGSLHSVERQTGSMRAEPAPFVARRARLHWAAMSPDGAALALTSRGLVAIDAAGRVAQQGLAADEALQQPLATPVRIGKSWWMLRPDKGRAGASVWPLAIGDGAVMQPLVQPLSQPFSQQGAAVQALAAYAYADRSALVGGDPSGMFLALDGTAGRRMRVWRLAADGTTTELASLVAPVRGGFVASERPGGGAYVAGHDGARSVVAVIDPNGGLGRVQASPIAAIGKLWPHAGGAWLIDAAERQVAWLDTDGRALATAAWDGEDNGAPCVDGRPLRRRTPAREPGSFIEIVSPNTCTTTTPLRLDGDTRWIGAQVDGLDTTPMLFQLPATPAAAARPSPTAATSSSAPAPAGNAACPPDMVQVSDALCVDRYEGQLVDAQNGVALSPDYPLAVGLLTIIRKEWVAGRWRTGDLHAQAMPLPALLRPIDAAPSPLGRSRRAVIPSGYVNGHVAKAACEAAGKRLCTSIEWEQACRGQEGRTFPYGTDYVHEACNVFRHVHPGARLHDNPSIGHLDPRLNRVRDGGETMLRKTGTTPRCQSRWGDDAIHDMVGNLDEWVEAQTGAGFAGGFYSRGTRKGCGSLITAHPRRYLDYSLGIRCCLSPSQPASPDG